MGQVREAHCLSLGRVNDSVARVPVVELIIVWGEMTGPLTTTSTVNYGAGGSRAYTVNKCIKDW